MLHFFHSWIDFPLHLECHAVNEEFNKFEYNNS
jgi:hypothetical protein